jgi:hypothetical protein
MLKHKPSFSLQSLSKIILPSMSPSLQLSSLLLKPVPSRRLLQSQRLPFPVHLPRVQSRHLPRVQSVHLRVQHRESMFRLSWIQLTTPALQSLFWTDNWLTALRNRAQFCNYLAMSCLTLAASLTYWMTILHTLTSSPYRTKEMFPYHL